jgi:hypothetical protein
LQFQPELRGAAEIAREAHGGIGSDTPALKNDVSDARRAQAQSIGKRVCAAAGRIRRVIALVSASVSGSV